MKKTTKEIFEIESNEAIEYLKGKYLKRDGTSILELVYISYNDEIDTEQLQEILSDGYMHDESWIFDAQNDTIDDIISIYVETLPKGVELPDAVRDEMMEWLQENDTSDITKDLLKQSGSHLFFIETKDEYIHNPDEQDLKNNQAVINKYAKTKEQKKDIESTFNESFYSANISFYFYADVKNMFDILHGKDEKSKYLTIEGAYCSTVTRGNGSNWMGNNNTFTITVPREDFLKNAYLDSAKGTGYSWYEIAGQNSYSDAQINATNTVKGVLIES